MFESRHEFLGFSEKNNYHFDILRRAKHSSMMILHHLHTSNKHHRCSQKSSRFSCGVCNKDVSTTIYFPCLICSIFRLCTGCFAKNTTHLHLHLFPSLPSTKGAQPRTVMVSIYVLENKSVSFFLVGFDICDMFTELTNLYTYSFRFFRY